MYDYDEPWVLRENTDIDNMGSAIQEATETVNTLESISKILNNENLNLSQENLNVLLPAINHLSARIGYTKTKPISLESFSSEISNTKQLQIAIENIAHDLWETIKRVFSTMLEWVKKFFAYLFSTDKHIEKEVDRVLELANNFSKSDISMEEAPFKLDTKLILLASDYGKYLGNDIKEIYTYVHSLADLDYTVIDTLKHCSDDFIWTSLNIHSAGLLNYKRPSSVEEKAFFKERSGLDVMHAKIVNLSFKKGFIWKTEGNDIDNKAQANVLAGIERINYVYPENRLDCLSIPEIKEILNTIKADVAVSEKNNKSVSEAIVKNISEKYKEIEKALIHIKENNEQSVSENKHKFSKIQSTLNAIKNIEHDYWQYKARTNLKIKEYCEDSIKTRQAYFTK